MIDGLFLFFFVSGAFHFAINTSARSRNKKIEKGRETVAVAPKKKLDLFDRAALKAEGGKSDHASAAASAERYFALISYRPIFGRVFNVFGFFLAGKGGCLIGVKDIF